jgi:hypothetical protein
MNTYLAWTRIGGLAHDKVTRSMELMASKVMPQLRGAGASLTPIPSPSSRERGA